MVIIQLLSTLVVLGFEQLVQWRYGAFGLFALILLTTGIRMRSERWLTVGAVLLVLLTMQA
ncbi:hypothetical protein CG723_24510 [Streptomyces sp. CB01635]|uniref:hypothetical protein n=1 Tax=unclassified Streptomyces TaxID=2593676 RepID=UPI000C27FA3E|nr:hypothetical protein [Streptomyces sp. CB01635]PJN09088.1 hypothetical protein CG723_24510 [Streptomyces sp. CB01635]